MKTSFHFAHSLDNKEKNEILEFVVQYEANISGK